MYGLPPNGARVRVWPFPGRSVQNGARTLDSGGRYLPTEGAEVVWDDFRLEQYRAGDLLLHEPPKPDEPKPEKAPERFDPAKAARAHLEALAKEKAAEKVPAAPAESKSAAPAAPGAESAKG